MSISTLIVYHDIGFQFLALMQFRFLSNTLVYTHICWQSQKTYTNFPFLSPENCHSPVSNLDFVWRNLTDSKTGSSVSTGELRAEWNTSESFSASAKCSDCRFRWLVIPEVTQFSSGIVSSIDFCFDSLFALVVALAMLFVLSVFIALQAVELWITKSSKLKTEHL